MTKISNTDFSHELKPQVSHCTKSFSQFFPVSDLCDINVGG